MGVQWRMFATVSAVVIMGDLSSAAFVQAMSPPDAPSRVDIQVNEEQPAPATIGSNQAGAESPLTPRGRTSMAAKCPRLARSSLDQRNIRDSRPPAA